MSDITFQLPDDATRIWDLQVPIIENKDDRILSIYMRDTIDEPCVYNEVCYMLDNAKPGSEVKLYLNTPGGVVDTAFMLADVIRRSKAKVVAHLAGTVASAGTLIIMACDDIIVAPFTSFMIHNYSGGAVGKGHELKARQAFVDKQLNEAFKAFYLGFLTEEEMTQVIDGTDFWMGADEIQERWNNYLSYKEQEV
jgi:ATP-dependent protease ClpP protease subunit